MEDLKRKYERLMVQMDLAQNKDQSSVEHNFRMNISGQENLEKQQEKIERTQKTLEKKVMQIAEHKKKASIFIDKGLFRTDKK